MAINEPFNQLEPTVESLQGRKGDFLEESEVPPQHVPAEFTDIAPALAKHIEDLEREVEQLNAAKEHEDMVFDNLAELIQDQRTDYAALRLMYQIAMQEVVSKSLWLLGSVAVNAILIGAVIVLAVN